MGRFLDIFETQILRTCDISDSSGLVLTLEECGVYHTSYSSHV